MDAEERQAVSAEVADWTGIGRQGNPIFPEVFRRPATAAGGSLLGVNLLAEQQSGIARVFNPAGGTHHGQASQARGFCYLNDPVLAILRLLDLGFARVFYLDIDAHHGDGVQQALSDDPRVMTLSIHEADRWPMVTGGCGDSRDRGGGQARNIPVPPGFNDSEMAYLLEAAVLPLIEAFAPEALVLQCGADALAEDPLSRLELSNEAPRRLLRAVLPLAPRLLLLGGGGYNPWSVARCWSLLWAELAGLEVPDPLPPAGEAVLRALSWRHSRGRNPPAAWFTSLLDRPRTGAIRDEIRSAAAAVLC